MIDKIIAYESGELDEEGTLELFQHLVDTGQAWTLQGHYGRTAAALIEAGQITSSSPSKSSRPELVGTACECGAPYDEAFGGYACAR